MRSCRIVSLLPAATEIAATLGLMGEIVGVSHECDYPAETNERPGVTHCPVHGAGLTSGEVDEWVRRALRENGPIYTIDEPLLHELRPDVILTQKLCDVCAVGYGTVAQLAETLPGPPHVVNLEPSRLSDIFDDIRRVAEVCGVSPVADEVIAQLSARVDAVRRRASPTANRPRCFLMEWVDPPVLFRSLGTRAGRDRGRTGSVRSQASTLNADRLAGSARRSSGDHRSRALRLRCRSCTARLPIARSFYRFRFASRSTSRRDLCRRRQRLFRPTRPAHCR